MNVVLFYNPTAIKSVKKNLNSFFPEENGMVSLHFFFGITLN